MLRQLPKFQRLSMKKIRKCSDMTLLSYAYAGIGNVLKVQSCDELVMNFFLKNETFAAPFYVYNC